tara:strand:- start:4989 stop:6413 length:1425 start_codon:yes stop_codon:yes gene_type:complete
MKIFILNKISSLNIRDFELIYQKLPYLIQAIIISLHGYKIQKNRFGKLFKKNYSESLVNYHKSISDIKKYQNNKLKRVLKAASQTSYWNEKFKIYGINIHEKDLREEIKKLPILTKEELKKNINKMILNKYQAQDFGLEKIRISHTSGTTGSGLIFKENEECEAARWATWWRYRNLNNINFKMWCGVFTGRAIIPSKKSNPPYWHINIPGKQILFSIYHLSDSTAIHYLKKLKKSTISWIHGYPSALTLISKYMIKHEISPLDNLKIITTGGENLLPHQKELIHKAFKVKVRDHYGQAEGVANFSQIKNNEYQVDEDYSIVEFVPRSRQNEYKIIGTSLNNLILPLIRYDTKDIAFISNLKNKNDLYNWRVVEKIDGREEDYLVLKDGCKVGRLDHIFKDLHNVVEAQFIQHEKGKADLLVVFAKGEIVSKSLNTLHEKLQKYLSNRIDINIIQTESIQKTNSGKLRFCISSIK